MSADSIPALSLAVAKDGRLIWEEAFGYADVQAQTAATSETPFAIGSLSKPLTATALMVLVQQARLNLDNPANEFLEAPGLQAHVGVARDATLRRLANHTSGLARHDIYYYDDEPREPLPIAERIRRYGHIVRVPGESYEYSNLGYMVLAHIIAQRSGRPFGEFMRAAVFEPVAMRHSSVGLPNEARHKAARSYNEGRRPLPIREGTFAGAGGVFSTAGDLARFGMFQLERPATSAPLVVSTSTLASMREPAVQTDSGAWYGIGWRIDRAAFGVETVYHTGSNGASASILAFVPAETLAVAVLANCVTSLPGWVAREVIASFGPRPVPATHPHGYPTARLGQEPYRPTSEWTGRWEGAIHAPDGETPAVFEFTESGTILVLLRGAQPDTASGVRMQDGYLRGSFSGEVQNRDTMGRRYRLHFKLRQSHDRLTGAVTASSVAGERVITLSYSTELRRNP